MMKVPVTPTTASSLPGTATPSFWASVARRWIVQRPDVRNIAVIAHVDHGKTTLVDTMLKQSGTMAAARNRVMDSKDQEKERGITILAKNTAIVLPDGRRVNIVDTPGHLDFSGEVERGLQMVEGFILLVDAQEGVRPGTRYVLRKALSLGLKPIICMNKIDKDDANLAKTEAQVQDLFLEMAESDDQLDLYFLYGSGRDGYMAEEPKKGGSLDPLFASLFDRVPAPKNESDEDPFQMLISQVDLDSQGRHVAIGRIFKGSIKMDDVVKATVGKEECNCLVKGLNKFTGTEKEPAKEAKYGDVVSVSLQAPIGVDSLPIKIGGSLIAKENGEAYPYQAPDAPTFSLVISSNKAAWAGKETIKTTNMDHLKKRVKKELMHNSAMQAEFTNDNITLKGRGPLHLSVFIEDMRREGMELEVEAPKVEMKMVDGKMCEPWEAVQLEVKDELVAETMQIMQDRSAEIGDTEEAGEGRTIVHSKIPVRLMLGLPVQFHVLTKGDGIFNHSFDGFHPCSHIASERDTGCLVAMDDGEVTEFGLKSLQDSGKFFVHPGDKVFKGQVVGENTKTKLQDQPVNVCKENTAKGGFRAGGVKNATKTNIKGQEMDFESCMAWAGYEESIVVTPESVRIRMPAFNGKTRMRKPGNKK